MGAAFSDTFVPGAAPRKTFDLAYIYKFSKTLLQLVRFLPLKKFHHLFIMIEVLLSIM